MTPALAELIERLERMPPDHEIIPHDVATLIAAIREREDALREIADKGRYRACPCGPIASQALGEE